MHPISCDCCSPATSSGTANWFCRMRHPLQPQSAHEQHPLTIAVTLISRGEHAQCAAVPFRSRAAASIADQPAANARSDCAAIKRTDRQPPISPTGCVRNVGSSLRRCTECPSCTERFLGQRRCGDCNLWCRKVGLGGECSGCAEILTIADLLGANPEGGALA